MTSKIKVDNINKISDDSNIIKKCGSTTTIGSGSGNTVVVDGSTVTLGRCGATVNLASGASQTGFGRTGTVDWQTGDIKTANFTASDGEGYFCNTTSGAFTVTLPSGSAGAIVSVQDYNNTFDTNALTVAPATGEKINGGVASASIKLGVQGQGVSFVYIDATVGWRSVQSNEFDTAGSLYVAATGGCITTCGNFKIHTFTSPGTFTVTAGGSPSGSDTVDYLVVAGGGGGGSGAGPDGGAGGGAGGFRLSNSTCMPAPLTSPLATPTALPVSAGSYPITIGSGGAGGNDPGASTSGSNSIFSSITSAGGGGGGNGNNNPKCGQTGGSGGATHQGTGADGNTPPVSPPQGNAGGSGTGPGGAGGGGAGAAGGSSGSGNGAGNGGDGSFVVQSGFASSNGDTGPVSSAKYFSGGGAGSNSPNRSPAGSSGTGGAGGGGNQGVDGSANTGGGGGATSSSTGNSGGSGIVIIRYQFQGS